MTEEIGQNTRRPWRKRLLWSLIVAVVLLAISVGGVLVYLDLGSGGVEPLAPDAPAARPWESKPNPAPTRPTPVAKAPETDFETEPGPTVLLKDVPEVPEQLLQPSEPLEPDAAKTSEG